MYVLVLGIEYQYFKRPGTVTVRVGDHFVDEFRLTRDYLCTNHLPHIESKWYDKQGKNHWLTRQEYIQDWKAQPSLIKVYELDHSIIQDKLKLHVQNSNSDYNNGFMSKSSLIKFSTVALFNKELVQNRGEKLFQILRRFSHHRYRCVEQVGRQKTQIYKWPSAHSFRVCRHGNERTQTAISDRLWWMGGSFTAEFPIKTKHQTKYLAPATDDKTIGFPEYCDPNDLMLATHTALLNTYNED